MRPFPFLLLIMAALVALPLRAAEDGEEVRHAIDHVTVYRQGAQIKRTATSVVPEGTATLVFPGLPTSIDPSEVRITGTGDFTILSVTHRYHTDTLSGAESQAERERLQLERNSLYHDMQQEQHWYTILDKEEQLLASHTQFTVKDSGVDLTRLIDATRFMRERRIELLQERQAIDQRIGDMQAALTKLDQAMAALPPSARRPTSNCSSTPKPLPRRAAPSASGTGCRMPDGTRPTTPGSNPCPTRSNSKASPWSSNRPGKIGTGST